MSMGEATCLARHRSEGGSFVVRVPEQFTTTPNDYPAPWWHQRDGEPRRYINPAYREYVRRRDRKTRQASAPAVAPPNFVTRQCEACGEKFPTTAPHERSCGKQACRLVVAGQATGEMDGLTECVECHKFFPKRGAENTCSQSCRESRRYWMRRGANRYRSLRPIKYGWDWEDHDLMAQLAQDGTSDVTSTSCEICGEVTYYAPTRGTAFSCSPEHEQQRQRRNEAASRKATNTMGGMYT